MATVWTRGEWDGYLFITVTTSTTPKYIKQEVIRKGMVTMAGGRVSREVLIVPGGSDTITNIRVEIIPQIWLGVAVPYPPKPEPLPPRPKLD